MAKLFVRIVILFFTISLLCGCLRTTPKKPPEMWWGKMNDEVEWQKAKVIMENYDWIVINQDVYLGE